MMSVEENKLARHDDESLLRVTIKCLIAAIEQLNELAGIAACWCVRELACGIECNTSLCGVRNDESDFWLVGKCHICPVLRIWVKCAADNVDTCERVHSLAVLTSLKVYVIEAVLTVEPVNHTFFNRLHNNYRAVEVGLLVHVPHNPVNECTQEVTLTKLDDLLRHNALRSSTLV